MVAREQRFAARVGAVDGAHEEIRSTLATLQQATLTLRRELERLLSPDDFVLPACRALMQKVKTLLDTDLGVVVLDRLPVESYSKDELVAAYWLLSSMIAPRDKAVWKRTRAFGSSAIANKRDVQIDQHFLVPRREKYQSSSG